MLRLRVPSPAPYINCDSTCRFAIENPPIPQGAPNNELTNQSETVVRRRHILNQGKCVYSGLTGGIATKCYRCKNQPDIQAPGPTKPAYTVTGSGGGGTHIYHWLKPHYASLTESAQGAKPFLTPMFSRIEGRYTKTNWNGCPM